MKVHLLTILVFISVFNLLHCDSRVRFTMEFWRDQDCETTTNNGVASTVCSVDNLEHYTTITFDYGVADMRGICMNIPGLNKGKYDPDNIIWNHSGTLKLEAQAMDWEDAVNNFCNETVTPHILNFRLSNDLGCKEENFVTEGSVPIGDYVPSPEGFDYTERITCEVYEATSKLFFNAFLLIALFSALLL